MANTGDNTLLAVTDLTVSFGSSRAVDGISFSVAAGETLGLVGESGCGKSTTALALMGLLQGGSTAGSAKLLGTELVGRSEHDLSRDRGLKLGMIFQDPGTALHPMIRVGDQLIEALRAHLKLSKAEARKRAVDLFSKVGIAAPEDRLRAYPHEMSGGMCQRVMIAMAIACNPKLLLADEPTTALDVTVQAQILSLLKDVAREGGMGVILITHDLGVVAGMTDRVAVMYAGEIVETAPTEQLFASPQHPYTQGLLNSIPQLETGHDAPMPVIPGSVQSAAQAKGCRFAPRCPFAEKGCEARPTLKPVAPGHHVACWRVQ